MSPSGTPETLKPRAAILTEPDVPKVNVFHCLTEPVSKTQSGSSVEQFQLPASLMNREIPGTGA